MRITLEQNSQNNNEAVPYLANIEIATITVDFNTQFQVPITQYTNGKTSFSAEVCGFNIEGDSPEAVVGLMERLIPSLVNMARLPTYMFIARRSHKMYPVYTYGDEVFAITPGGPLFKHVELAKVREYLTGYMHEIKALGSPGMSEKLHVRGVHRRTLGLVRPIFYLKKRPETKGDNEFWAPVFPSKNSDAIYTYAVSGRRETDMDNGHEVLRLRSQVAQALIADKRLREDLDLRIDRLLPQYWMHVKPHLEVLPSQLAFDGSSFDIYKNGKYLIAVEYRNTEDRYSLYLGKSVDELRTRTAKDLVRRKLIADPTVVRIVG